MNKRVNFEDNIFVLFARIRIIRDLFILDADPEIFLDKTLDDIDFIDNTIKNLFARLMENPLFIEREEVLSHLSELEWQFCQVLSILLDGGKTLSVRDFPALKEKIMILRARSLERQKAVENSGSGENQPEEPLVSVNELSELLKSL